MVTLMDVQHAPRRNVQDYRYSSSNDSLVEKFGDETKTELSMIVNKGINYQSRCASRIA